MFLKVKKGGSMSEEFFLRCLFDFCIDYILSDATL